MPTVSVIVPVYNVEHYLRRCVDSILTQTFTDYELILVDDGSPDSCGAICDDYAEKDNRIIVLHTMNRGQAAARNTALDIAKGDYVAFIDADDYVHPQMLLWLVSAAKKLNVDIVNFQCEEGKTFNYTWSGEQPSFETVSARDFLRESILKDTKGGWVLWDKLYKRKCFEGIRMPEGRILEDNATVYKVLYQADQIAVTDIVLYYYYQREDSTMHLAFSEKRLDWLTTFDEMIDFFTEHNEDAVAEWLSRRYLKGVPRSYQKALKECPHSDRLPQIRNRTIYYFKRFKSKLRLGLANTIQLYGVCYPRFFPMCMKLGALINRIKRKLQTARPCERRQSDS